MRKMFLKADFKLPVKRSPSQNWGTNFFFFSGFSTSISN